eukprot:gene6071-6146_t
MIEALKKPMAIGEMAAPASCLPRENLVDILLMEDDALKSLLEDEDVIVIRGAFCPDKALASLADRVGGVLHGKAAQASAPVAEEYLILGDATAGGLAEYFRNSHFWENDWLLSRGNCAVSIMAANGTGEPGGQTEFCRTAAAWDSLTVAEQHELAPMRVLHAFWHDKLYHEREPQHARLVQWMADQSGEFPLAQRLPGGRKCLLAADSAIQVVGRDFAGSEEFLGCLRDWMTEPRFVYHHDWQPGDLVIWNSASVMYRNLPRAGNPIWKIPVIVRDRRSWHVRGPCRRGFGALLACSAAICVNVAPKWRKWHHIRIVLAGRLVPPCAKQVLLSRTSGLQFLGKPKSRRTESVDAPGVDAPAAGYCLIRRACRHFVQQDRPSLCRPVCASLVCNCHEFPAMNVLVLHSRGSEDHAGIASRLDDLMAVLRADRGDVRVITRDLGALVPIEVPALREMGTPDAEKPAYRATRARSDLLVEELEAADLVVIAAPTGQHAVAPALTEWFRHAVRSKAYGAPVYPLCLAQDLRNWFDHVIRADRTFFHSAQGPQGLLADKRALVLAAHDSPWRKGPMVVHQVHSIETLLRFMGIEDVFTIAADDDTGGEDDGGDAAGSYDIGDNRDHAPGANVRRPGASTIMAARSALRLMIPTLLMGIVPVMAVQDLDDEASATFPGQIPPRAYHAGPVMDPGRSARIVTLHNEERARMQTAPLAWDEALARDAAGWAWELARTGEFEHASEDQLRGQGENLFMGTAGAFSVDDMIGAFLEERSDFQPGVFPDVARDNDWEGVGHYTQIIWPTTRRVGCAVARARGMDVMVCRYFPSGNVYGERVP